MARPVAGLTTIVLPDGAVRVRFDRLAARVVRGPDAGREIEIGAAEVRVGSHPSNQLVLADPRVSRFHLRLAGDERGVRAIDLGSANGTTIAGLRVRDVYIGDGTVIEVGDSALEIRALGGAGEEALPADEVFGELVGRSVGMRRVFGVARRAAGAASTVLILGETGTGKDLLARAIHGASPRAAGPFVVFDCGALVGNLLDSELFGHVRGAFTGADTAKRGLFLAADGGTLFLDEIGELPLELQPKLLRALQDGEVKPVGGTSAIRVDARVIAATNRALAEQTKTGAFREDLYYRLAVITIEVPALRDRRGDIPLLARHFAEQAALRAEKSRPAITDAALAHLAAQPWPGNVRELENAIERAVILASGDVLDVADVASPHGRAAVPGLQTFTGDHVPTLDELERAHILKVLEMCDGQKTKAAAMLGINRTTLWKKLRQYGLET